MIQLSQKEDCCGCEACVQICPKQCISFSPDWEGFRYPMVDLKSCIHCNRCEKVCPVIHPSDTPLPDTVYAVIHPNGQIRKKSSSGGAFSALAVAVIHDGGVVFGARFDEHLNVVHGYTESLEGLECFRGSKYVQSRIGLSYVQTEKFLKAGRKVLFSGTPCQIAGLKRYLHKAYDNLLTAEVVCHGVPSPKVWQAYLKTIQQKVGSSIKRVSFRDKRYGWKAYQLSFQFAALSTECSSASEVSIPHVDDSYMQAFLKDFSLRPSCYHCPNKLHHTVSDLTLGDFWGIEYLASELDDDQGICLMMVHRPDAESWIRNVLDCSVCFPLQAVVSYNPSLIQSVRVPVNRSYFFWQLARKGFEYSWRKTQSPSLWNRIHRRLFRFIYPLLCE